MCTTGLAANAFGFAPNNGQEPPPACQANLWNAPSISSGLKQLAIGGFNPGIPGGNAIDGGLAGVYTSGAIKAASINVGEAAGETAASVVGAAKFAYDLGAWAYAYIARCK